MNEPIPDGFEKLERPSLAAVVRSALRADVEAALIAGTVYDFARFRPDVTAYEGRGHALAFSAPVSGARLVVRRSRHGGLFAPITGELFMSPGRAPHELRTSIALQNRGIRTTDLAGYLCYDAAIPLMCRTDVLTSFVPDARDLSALLRNVVNSDERDAALRATAALLAGLARARARHPDLNLRNILIVRDEHRTEAIVIDVDRVQLDAATASEVSRANLARLLRSADKLERQSGKVMLDARERQILVSDGPAA